jgi:hypothetical protein
MLIDFKFPNRISSFQEVTELKNMDIVVTIKACINNKFNKKNKKDIFQFEMCLSTQLARAGARVDD